MPKVTATTARKDGPKACPQAKAGQRYYWWRTRMKGARSGVTRCSLTPPKRSQLTQSEYVGAVLAISEDMDASSAESIEDFEAMRDEWAQQIRDVGEEQRDKLSNMPEQLQQGDTGYLLEERADACDAWAEEVEAVSVEEVYRSEYPEGPEGDDDYAYALAEAIQDAINECSGGCPE